MCPSDRITGLVGAICRVDMGGYAVFVLILHLSCVCEIEHNLVVGGVLLHYVLDGLGYML